MTAHKIAVSLPPHAVERARAAVREGRAASVSAYIARALEEQAKTDDLRAMLDEMLEETGGPVTPEEKREAERIFALGAGPEPQRGPKNQRGQKSERGRAQEKERASSPKKRRAPAGAKTRRPRG